MDETSSCVIAELFHEFAEQAGLSRVLLPFEQRASLQKSYAKNPFLMAPMAGVSDASYRMMARAGGAAVAYSEMVSVSGIHYAGSKTWELALPHDAEPDIAVQLFGREPKLFEEACAALTERLGKKLVLLDINMACPVPKVVKKGEGSALLDEPERAAEIVKACKRHTDVPVTVKLRIGRTPDHIVAAQFGRVLEDAGVSALAIHGRSASQLYRGLADWKSIKDVVKAVDIPVIASGDIFDAQTALRALDETGASAVFIARGSYGCPWIFRQAQDLACGRKPLSVSFDMRLRAFELHLRLLEVTAAHLARARSLAGWYFKGMPHAADFRRQAMECSSVDEFFALTKRVRELQLTREGEEYG